MAQTHGRAHCVFVWLGCGSPSIEKALKKVQTDARCATKLHGSATSFSEAIRDFASLPYWSRLWVVQDVLLARPARIHYGAFNMSWKHFARILQVWFVVFDNVLIDFEILILLQQDVGPTKKPMLTDLVLRFRGSQCRDPRD